MIRKTINDWCVCGGVLGALSLWCVGSAQAVPNYYDAFDALYSAGFTFPTATSTNGWQASSAGAMVNNSGAYSAPNAVCLAESVALTNTQNASTGLVVWTDYEINPQYGLPPPALPTNVASFLSFFNTNGYLTVATPSGLQVFTNDVWGNPAPVATNGYVRVTIYQNYLTSTQAVLLNGQLIAQNLPFGGTSSNYNQAVFQNSVSNSFLDNVWIKTNYDTTTLTNDINGNGIADAAELMTYGYAARILHIGGAGAPNYPTFLAALNAAVWPRDMINVQAGSYAEDVLASNAVTFTGGAFTNTGSLTVTLANGVVFQTGMSWGTINLNTNTSSTFNQGVTCSNLTIRSGATVVMTSLICSNLVVEPGAHFSCSGAFQCSGSSTFGQNAVVIFSGSVTNSGIFSVASGSSVTFSQGASLGAMTMDGNLVVGAGQTVTVTTTAAVSGNVQVTGSGTLSVGTSLSVTGAGVLSFTGSRLLVPPSHVDMTGTFSISNTPGTAATIPLPFADDFEAYLNNTVVTNLGFRGWYASSGAVAVENTIKNSGSNGVVVPAATVLSNRVTSGSATNIWTEFYVQPTIGLLDMPPTNSASFVAYVNTNRALVVAVSGGGWVVCSNKIDNITPVPPIQSNTFTRIDVFQDRVKNTFAVFVAGDLVAQGLSAPTPLGAYASLGVINQDGTAYLDDVLITPSIPGGLISDLDGDGTNDAVEIAQKGFTYDPPMLAAPTVVAIGTNGATLGASITNSAGAAIDSWGTVWDTNASPTAHSTVTNGSPGIPFTFTQAITNMAPGQHIYARGWAHNIAGTGYSTETNFFTEPVQASNLVISAVSTGSFTVSWTADASSTGTVVLVKQGAPVDAAPVDGSNYTQNASYGSGNALGISNYIVYASTGTSVTVSNLIVGTKCQVVAFAYAGSADLIQYRTNNPPTAAVFTEPVQATGLTAVPVAGGFTISWTADATSTGTVVLVTQGDEVTAAPEDGSNYVGGTYLGSSNYIVYAGFGGSNVMVNSLIYGVHYTAAAYDFAGSSDLIQYRTNNPATCFLEWPPQGSVFKIR